MNNNSSSENTSTTRLIIIAVAVVALLLGGFYIWLNKSQTEQSALAPPSIDRSHPTIAPTQAVIQETPVDAAPMEAAPEVTSKPMRPIVPAPASIESSDNQVKLAVADLAPGMEAWVVPDQQIRKWVLAIDNMADGDVPKQYRPLSYPVTRFEPEVRGAEPNQQFFIKSESYKRTDLFVNLLLTIDPQYFAQYYRAWLPLLEKAYQEQGKKDKFDQRFRVVLQHIVDVKPLASAPELKKRGGVIYVYADEKLEAASDVEKMLWRMGPDNSLKIQGYVKQIQQYLPK